MTIAYVLINVELGLESEVLASLRKIEGVEEAYRVYGTYDVVVKIKADTFDKLQGIVTWHVRRLAGVRSSLTTIVAEESK